MFHNMLEQFFIENNKKYNNKDTNINKTFYYIQKLIMEDLSSFEKNELYRDYMIYNFTGGIIPCLENISFFIFFVFIMR